MRRLAKVLFIVFTELTFLCMAQSVRAQEGDTLPKSDHPETKKIKIPAIQNSIELDGEVNESEWQNARSLPLIQQKPNYGESPSEKTEVLIGHTEENLYVACRCFDRYSPSAPSFKRDYNSADSDLFAVILDTFNDNENAVVFLTSPAGQRADLTINDDASGDVPFDKDWDSFWEAEAIQNGKGWFAEMKIPFSSLRFDANENGSVVMGMIVGRFLSRKNEYSIFPDIPNKWGFVSHLKPSQAEDVVLEDINSDPPLRVTPYLLGGFGQQNQLNNSEAAYNMETDPIYDAGLDVKYGLTSNMTLDVTVNTDFAQVEADNQQVNLTRFPLFFPEKRRFFQERSSNFSFNFNATDRLFYSRRIGLSQGEQVRILGGARLVGRSGPWDIGVLNMQTAKEPDIRISNEALPSENFGVVRVQRQVLNENSYAGGIFTSRLGRDGTYNVAYGLDGRFRVSGERYFSVKWAQTFRDQMANDIGSLDPSRIQVQWENRSYDGIGYDLRYDRSGQAYEPGIGFQLRQNYYRFGDRISYGWITEGESSIQRHRFSILNEAYFRNKDGSIQSLEVGPQWELLTKSNHSFNIEATRRIEDLEAPFILSKSVEIPADRYSFFVGSVSYQMPSSWNFRTNVGLSAGEFYDGKRWSAEISPTWNASRYVRMSGFYQWNELNFAERDQELTTHVGRLRVEVTPNVKYSISGFVQYNSAGGLVIGNVRFRYNPRQGNDFYLVYNEQLNADRAASLDNPRLPLTNSRTILLKYTYTFNW